MRIITTGSLRWDGNHHTIWVPNDKERLCSYAACVQYVENPFLETGTKTYHACRLRPIGGEGTSREKPFEYHTLIKDSETEDWELVDMKRKETFSEINMFAKDTQYTVLSKYEQEQYLESYPKPQWTLLRLTCLNHVLSPAMRSLLECERAEYWHNMIEIQLGEMSAMSYKEGCVTTSFYFYTVQPPGEKTASNYVTYEVAYPEKDRSMCYIFKETVQVNRISLAGVSVALKDLKKHLV